MKLTAGTPIKLPHVAKPLDFGDAAEVCQKRADEAEEVIKRCVVCNLVGGQCGCRKGRLETPCPKCDWTGYVQAVVGTETRVKRCEERRCVQVLKARIAKGQRERVGTNALNEEEDD